ncbi:MAG: hypothetical protein R6V01_06810 [Thermoplasmatota archaeon]
MAFLSSICLAVAGASCLVLLFIAAFGLWLIRKFVPRRGRRAQKSGNGTFTGVDQGKVVDTEFRDL